MKFPVKRLPLSMLLLLCMSSGLAASEVSGKLADKDPLSSDALDVINSLAPETLEELMELEGERGNSGEARKKMRLSMLKRVGFELGLAQGARHHLDREEGVYRDLSGTLDQVFDFRSIMNIASSDIDHQGGSLWFPAIVREVKDVIETDSNGQFFEYSEARIEILEPEKMISSPPRWQDFLLGKEEHSEYGVKPGVNATPSNDEERAIWRASVSEGWHQSMIHARREMEQREANLARIYLGSLTYMRLYLENRIKPGYVSAEYVAASGSKTVQVVNKRTYAITNTSVMNHNIDDWKSAIDGDPGSAFDAFGLELR